MIPNRILKTFGLATICLSSLALLAWVYPIATYLYRSADTSMRVDISNPCTLKPFSYQLRRYGQVFKGAVYPTLTLQPCTRHQSTAFFGGRFHLYKITGDQSEGCSGDASIKLRDYGKVLDLQFVNRGSVPGFYCRDIKNVIKYRLYRQV